MKHILVITDNGYLLNKVRTLINEYHVNLSAEFTYCRSTKDSRAKMYGEGLDELPEINVKTEWPTLIETYDLVFSLHCKQIFPRELVNGVRCVNIHPGYNPHNRGWYPQVFAIKDGKVIGATIHEMDENIDCGRIIARRMVPIHSEDTSLEVYERVLETEMDLLKDNLSAIIDNTYDALNPESEGTYHTKKDFEQLCQLNLSDNMSLSAAINLLRGLSHGDYPNAYFIDPDGNKVFVKIQLTKTRS
jgi:methionyl-tRNA formyltransferase